MNNKENPNSITAPYKCLRKQTNDANNTAANAQALYSFATAIMPVGASFIW